MLTFKVNLLGSKNYAKNFPCICTYDLLQSTLRELLCLDYFDLNDFLKVP